MFTRRVSLPTLAGLLGVFLLVGSLGMPASAPAQATKSGIKEKTKAGAQATQLKWESLTPDQQANLQAEFKEDAAKAQAKWNGMTPEAQQKVITKARAGGAKAAETWKNLPQ